MTERNRQTMNSILAVWKSLVEAPLQGVADWLARFMRATQYHPEKAYMRARRDDGGRSIRRSF